MKLKNIFFSALILFCLHTITILPAYHTEVETFFLPASQNVVYSRLASFLDRAKSRILIAMYWITDEGLFNKLIELKKNGIDIQIIFDESTPDAIAHFNAFIRNNIIPIILPLGTEGLMHNKFVVIDNFAVWTGSANFTQKNLHPGRYLSNYENIVIINSSDAAKQYTDAFFSIATDIMEIYLQKLSDELLRPESHDWLIPLCKKLLENNDHFNQIYTEILKELNQQGQFEQMGNLVLSLAPELPSQSQEFAAAGAEDSQTDDMSQWSRCDQMQDPVLNQSPEPTSQSPVLASPTTEASEEEATPEQKEFLASWHHQKPYISKKDADALIKEIEQISAMGE